MKNKYYQPSEKLAEKRQMVQSGRKICTKCGVVKNLSEFHIDRNHWTGRCQWCRTCKINSNRNYRDSNPKEYYESIRFSQARIRYGIDKQDYILLLESQDYLCAICSEKLDMSRQTHIDHCHTSGKIRGVLCGSCNKGIGMFKDSPDLLRSAAAYLDKF